MSMTSIRIPAGSSTTSQIVTLPAIPELFDSNFLDALVPVIQNTLSPKGEPMEVPSSAVVAPLRSTSHKKVADNSTSTIRSSPFSTLDAYLGLRTGVSGEDVDRYLENAWAEDPNLTLRIIWSTRSIHDGKGEKELFYRTFGWLFAKHPRTAITNLHYLVDPVCLTSDDDVDMKKGASHGTWKDLLDILALATADELGPRAPLEPRSNFLHNHYDKQSGSRPAFKNNKEQEKWSRAQRVERSRRAHEHLTQKLLDKHFRALYVAVARLFAAQLTRESDIMDKIDTLPHNTNWSDRMALEHALTFASKWAPTPGGSHDRITNISSAICLLLHAAKVPCLIAQGLSTVATEVAESEMHILRSLYQRHVLTRGRRLTCIPESFMSSNRWSEVVYSRVASTCMNKNKKSFFVHDEERLLDYLEDVESGKRKTSGATLLPHVLAMEAYGLYRQDSPAESATERSPVNVLLQRRRPFMEAQTMVVDAQWATLVGRLRESGQLDNSIAICDVSGSMGSINNTATGKSPFEVDPIWPAISLSLLVAWLAKPPFNDSFITFSERPQFTAINPEARQVPLGATIDNIYHTNFGPRTDFKAVFLKLILPLAIKHHVPKSDMIKRILVFTDMQFDKGNAHKSTDAAAMWKKDHDVVARAYAQAGYDVPELIYWDLSNPQDGRGITVPVTGEREGVTLLSGYSPALLRVFVDIEEVEKWDILEKESWSMSPSMRSEESMRNVLGRKSYDGLVVMD